MKKIHLFIMATLLMVCGVVMAKSITVYVQAETAPYIWSWGASDGVDYNVGDWPGTNQFKETWTDPATGDLFWKYSFPESVTSISYLLNNGDPVNTAQTGNVENVTSDRYFILNWDDGSLEDVTENYIVIPDAEVNSLGISGNHNGWGLSDGSEFTLVGGKTFTATIDLTGYDIPNDIWEFKLRPNLSGWVGYYEVTISGNIPSWLSDNYGNFMVDLTQTGRIFNITATWAGGKDISQGWSMKIESEYQTIDVPTALSIATNLGAGESTTDYYDIKGVVSRISSIDTDKYGNATFYIYTPGYENQELYVYRAYGYNKEKITDPNIFKEGDEVILHARLTNYKGSTPETLQNDAWLLAVYPAGGGIIIPGITEAFQMDGTSYGLSSEPTPIGADFQWYGGENMDVYNPFEDNLKTVNAKNDEYTYVIIGDNTFSTSNAVQGSTNPKDVDGNSPALSLMPPANGWAVKVVAKKDGWIYIPTKLSTNKAYMVFEDGLPIGYKYALESIDERAVNNVIAGEIKPNDGNYITEPVDWLIRNYTGDPEASTAGFGLGVIYFKVKAGSTYLACACGSKISWSGIYFTSTEAQSVKVINEEGGALEIATADPSTEGDKSAAYRELYNTIAEARTILNNTKLTPTGVNQLEGAITAAGEALATEVDETMTAATTALRQVINDVLTNAVLPSETINLRYSNGWHSWYGNEWINGQNANVLIAPGNINNGTPESNYNYLYFYWGNTMTVRSNEMPIVAIDFGGNIYGTLSASTGTMKNSTTWEGDADEVTFTHVDQSNTYNIWSITVYFDNPSETELVERIASQVAASETAIAALAYPNVKGKAELAALIEEARALTAESDKEVLKAALRNMKTQTDAVVALDMQYQTLERLLQAVENTIQQNPNADATYAAEATAKVGEIRDGMASGAYSADDIATLTAQMNRYNYLLAQVYLTIDVTEAGTLGYLILDRTANLTDVKGLRVSGKLNSTDFTTIKNLTNLMELNMAETNVTTWEESQFSGMTSLEKVVLPNEMTSLNKYSFQGCTALNDVTLPPNLRVINTGAFSGCNSLEQITFPETLENISADAFYGDSRYIDGKYVYGSLKEVTFPAALRKLGVESFYNQRNLKKVTFADGLTEISRDAFNSCSSLSELTLPSTLQTIGSSSFYECDALTRVELPEGLTTLGSHAFGYCNALEEVVLPSSLQSISASFYSCTNLRNMTAKAIVPANANNSDIIGDGYEAQCTLTVPALSKAVYQLADKWATFNIVTADIMPENIYVVTDYRLTWPDELSLDYRPNVYVGSAAALTVSGNSTLSASNFVLNWDAYQARYNGKYDSSTGNYYYDRDNCYAVLKNLANARADKVWINLKTRTNVWDFISLPFDVRVGDIIPMDDAATPFVIRKYDGEKRAQGMTGETWVNMTADDVLQAGQGYIWQSASTDESRNYNNFQIEAQQTVNKNNIFANEDLEIALNNYESEFEHNRSWNFIGNPFPAYYDIRAMKTTAPITVWNAYNGNYQAYSPQDDAYILNPGQAFFLQKPIDQESITFRKEGRQIDMEIRDIEEVVVNNVPLTSNRSVFNLTLSGNDVKDQTRFVINPMTKMDYEASHDASKFMSTEESAIELYTVLDNVRYAINERPLFDGIVELGMQIKANGTYTLALDTKVMNEIYLIDRQTGEETRIDGTEGYSFYAEAGTIEGRFAIRIGDGETTGISIIGNNGLDKDAPIYNLNGQRVNANMRGIYIQNGKKTVVK